MAKMYQITIKDGNVKIGDETVIQGFSDRLEIRVLEGTIGELNADGSVNCNNVAGNVRAGGSVNCDNVGGDVSAGGSVNCDKVGGSVKAGGSVRIG